LQRRGGYPTVRLVPDHGPDGIPEGKILPVPPGECDRLVKRLQKLGDEIAELERRLDGAVNDIE
jgi:hypothetical protein